MACGFDGACSHHGTCLSTPGGGRFCACDSDHTGFNDFYYRSNDCGVTIATAKGIYGLASALSWISVLVLIMHTVRSAMRYRAEAHAAAAADSALKGNGSHAHSHSHHHHRKSWLNIFPNRAFLLFLVAQSAGAVFCTLRAADDHTQKYALGSSDSYAGTVVAWIWFQVNVIGYV